jgi:hypothetical protein
MKPKKIQYAQTFATLLLTAIILLLLTACEQLTRSQSRRVESQANAQTNGALVQPSSPCSSGPQWRGHRGWGRHGRRDHPHWRERHSWGGQYGRHYDLRTVETVRGEINQVEIFTPWRGMGGGVHLQLKTAQENLAVHLGPNWYLEQQNLNLGQGDTIQVKGSRVTFEGEPTVIAAEITQGEKTLTLRDQNGFPVWSGCPADL